MTNVRALGVCTVFAFALSVPAAAIAKHQRYSAAFCSTSSVGAATGKSFHTVNARLNDSSAAHSTVNHGWIGDSTGGPTNVVCPIVSTDYLDHGWIDTVNIHGQSPAAGNMKAKLCWTSWSGNSGSCSGAANANSGANASISFNNSNGVFSAAGATASDFVYVFVQLADSSTMLRGYYTQD